jgi:multidrug efflux pump subunit AcrA (membrane-fusion protein)
VQLFRPEALRGQDRLHGDVVLVPTVSWRLLGLFLLATLMVAAGFLATARHARVIPVTGVIETRGGAAPHGRAQSNAPSSPQLQARFLVPAAAAAFVRSGQPIRIAVDTSPPHSFGPIDGRIESVSAAAALSDGKGTTDTFVVRATIDDQTAAAFGRQHPLRPGMAVSGRITTRSRSLAQWLLDPLLPADLR